MTVSEIVEGANAVLVQGQPERGIEGVSTDSRTLKEGEIFIALEGDKFDGHDFLPQALERGAAGVIIRDVRRSMTFPPHVCVMSVRDTLTALGDVASAYRARFAMPFVAITGSNGKTTTKEMAAHVLWAKGKLVYPKKSFNNFIGVPLTLFDVMPEVHAVILEMGTSAPGEISRLCEIARPTTGCITNIGASHLESLKSIMGIAAAKGELLEAIAPGGLAILNADDEWCRRVRKLAKCNVITFGTMKDADIIATDIHEDAEGLSFITNEHVRIEVPVVGRHNVHNALAAIGICRRLGMTMTDIAARLASFRGVPQRLELVHAGGVTVIDDTYNANPVSMAAALDAYRRFRPAGARHFVCGDMLELGKDSPELHRQLGLRIAESGIDRLWLFGKESKHTLEGALAAGFDREAADHASSYRVLEKKVLNSVVEGDIVLVKGSRGMRLERIVEALCRRNGGRKD